MIVGMNPFYTFAHPICRHFRTRRIQKFIDVFRPGPETRILDVGGLPRFWTANLPVDSRITVLNLEPLEECEASLATPNMTCVVGDGTQLQYDDREFDIVFSNSVVEHVGTFENQIAFAREARRVGRGYWVQTPAHEFPVEPHYWSPFIHWLPKEAQKHLLRNFTLWGIMGRPDKARIEAALAEVRLMKRREVQELFPDGQIWTERLAGLAKSYTVYKLPVP
jgi:hypothetical protein